jgi:toxin FitB
VSFLLDTNVLSEMRRPKPDENVYTWLDQADEAEVFISVISLAEIQRGLSLMDRGRRRKELENWLHDALLPRFDGRILGVTAAIALVWGRLAAQAKHEGFGLGVMDAALAATAQVHNLRLVTRNTKDFQRLDVELLNPWIAAQ